MQCTQAPVLATHAASSPVSTRCHSLRARAPVASSAIATRARVPSRAVRVSQWFALRAAVLRLANGSWLLPLARQRAWVQSVPGSAQFRREPLSLAVAAVGSVEAVASNAGAALAGHRLPCTRSAARRGAHMETQLSALQVQAQAGSRRGQAQSHPNPSVKRTCPGVPWHAAYLKR
jgi:hypothetical protein